MRAPARAVCRSRSPSWLVHAGVGTLLVMTLCRVSPARAEPGRPPPADAAEPAGPPRATGGAPEDPKLARAKQHFEAGRTAYNAGDYANAIKEFKAAEALRPSPLLSYNIGLANEKLGKRRVALKFYRRYLEEQPAAANRAEVEQKIATLEQELAQKTPPPPPPSAQAPAPAEPPPAGAAMPPPPAPTAPPGSDYPPPDPNAPHMQPSAGPPPPMAPPPPAPHKKKSYWWIGLIVGGAVTITVIAVVVWWWWAYDVNTVNTYSAAPAALTPAPRIDRRDIQGVTLFHF